MQIHSRPDSRLRTIALLGLASTLWLIALSAGALQGPPEHVRRSVDAVLELLRSEGPDTIRHFLDSAVDPAWLESSSADELAEELATLRDSLRGIDDDIAVEREADGVRLEMSGGGRAGTVRLRLTEAGVAGVTLVEVSSAQAPGSGGGRDAAVSSHVRAIESSAQRPLNEVLADFEQERFSDAFLVETTQEERRALLAAARTAAGSAGGAMLDEENDEIVLRLVGPGREAAVRFRVGQAPPFAIDSFRVEEGEPVTPLSWEQLAATFEELERSGFSGVVHFVREGEVVLERGYGMANPELGYPVEVDTVFGIGSTPIDFTVAGLFVLVQRGLLALDDPISEHLPEVPADKASMTLRHLISGRSGLPDFHHRPGDWDADLAWIDRDTAVRRILEQPLLFEPGTGRAHSHSAYGLVAAILELVSGEDYETFVRRELFERAGMSRTGMYGVRGVLELRDFAVGRGASSVGLPNIPPNWGPTSWLVMGSGGMYSTVPDLLRFYRTMRSGDVLRGDYAARYQGETVGVGGSDRGFFMYHAANGRGSEALVLINGEGRTPEMRELTRRIESLVLD